MRKNFSAAAFGSFVIAAALVLTSACSGSGVPGSPTSPTNPSGVPVILQVLLFTEDVQTGAETPFQAGETINTNRVVVKVRATVPVGVDVNTSLRVWKQTSSGGWEMLANGFDRIGKATTSGENNFGMGAPFNLTGPGRYKVIALIARVDNNDRSGAEAEFFRQ